MLIPQVAGGSVALCQRLDVSSWVVGVFREQFMVNLKWLKHKFMYTFSFVIHELSLE